MLSIKDYKEPIIGIVEPVSSLVDIVAYGLAHRSP